MKKHSLKKAALSISALLLGCSPLLAQDKVEAYLGADITSKYIWRGVYQSGASVQPAIGASYKGFSLGAWGSTTLGSDGFKEFDFSLGYTCGGFSVTATDYYWQGERTANPDGSYYRHYLDNHLLEGSLAYYFGESLPLTVSWSTFFAGELDKNAKGKRKYSSYFEVGYDFAISGIDFTASVGGSPWEAPAWLIPADGKDGFRISQVSVKASKDIAITSSFVLPVFVQAIASPATDDAHLVFGLSF